MNDHTDEQPIEGETVLFCAHEAVAMGVFQGDAGELEPNRDPRMHFFRVRGLPFKSPDGEQGLATWVVICDACFRSGRVGDRFLIGGHGAWQGNAQAIVKPGLMIQVGQSTVPISGLQVVDLWHLVSAIAKTGECLAGAREEEISSASHAEDVLETLLNDAPLLDGDKARVAVLDVWRLASASVRALFLIEEKLQGIIESLGAARHEGALDRAAIVGLRQQLVEILLGEAR